MSKLFAEEMIDQDEVRHRIPGRYDEDYEVFKCPACTQVYLIDAEDGTIFIDAADHDRAVTDDRFRCSRCGWRMQRGEIILGPKAETRFRPTVSEVRESPWAWIIKAE